ncbi:MAG: hypothetical protein IH991_12220 [Planctomycetes bacterium]|nr:hypothetical protein [Planctomycetota bacterium]
MPNETEVTDEEKLEDAIVSCLLDEFSRDSFYGLVLHESEARCIARRVLCRLDEGDERLAAVGS